MQKKLHHRLDWVQNTALDDTVKKALSLKIFPKLCKTFFCVYYYRAYFILSLKSKLVTERNKRLSLFIDQRNQFLIPAVGSLKMTYARSYARGSWIFNKRRGFGSFFAACLTQTSKITVTCPKWLKRTKWGGFWLAPS